MRIYDRTLYINSTGHLVYGIGDSGSQNISSPQVVTDSAWHHVVVTQSSVNGAAMYLDGKRVAYNASMTTPKNYTGWWRWGCSSINGWPTGTGGGYPDLGTIDFNGNISHLAVYTTPLNATQIFDHYQAGER